MNTRTRRVLVKAIAVLVESATEQDRATKEIRAVLKELSRLVPGAAPHLSAVSSEIKAMRQAAIEQRRSDALAELEQLLLDEWDTTSAVHPPLVAPQPATRPPQISVEQQPPPALSDSTKRIIAIVATTIGLAIAAALKGAS